MTSSKRKIIGCVTEFHVQTGTSLLVSSSLRWQVHSAFRYLTLFGSIQKSRVFVYFSFISSMRRIRSPRVEIAVAKNSWDKSDGIRGSRVPCLYFGWKNYIPRYYYSVYFAKPSLVRLQISPKALAGTSPISMSMVRKYVFSSQSGSPNASITA